MMTGAPDGRSVPGSEMVDTNPAPRTEDTRPYVLVVDDDPGVRAVLRAGLENSGYRVEVAGSGEEALPLLDVRCPDVLISDLIMPGVSGEELARRCHERCPKTHLVFVSGFPPEQLRSLGVSQVVFLTKPVSIMEVRSLLKRLLG